MCHAFSKMSLVIGQNRDEIKKNVSRLLSLRLVEILSDLQVFRSLKMSDIQMHVQKPK